MRKFEILCQKIILVEGDDDKNFFDKFIEFPSNKKLLKIFFIFFYQVTLEYIIF